MTLSETIDSFTPDKQDNLKASLRNEMGCHEPDCNLALQIAAGSLSVTSILTIPDTAPTSGVNATALVANVEAAATQLVAQPPAALSASLGVPVESTAPVAVQANVVVPLVVAPPPPSSPPAPPSPPPPSPPPADSGLSLPSLIGIIGGAGGVAVLVVLAVILFQCTKKKKKKDATGGAAAKPRGGGGGGGGVVTITSLRRRRWRA